MPTVSRVVGPEVGVDALPGARSTARLDPNFNQPLVEGVASIGKAAAGIYQAEQDKADTASLLEARRKLSDWERAWFNPSNPEGIYAKKGRDALGLEDKVAPDFDRVTAELGGNLRSEKARNAFNAMALSQRDSVLGRVQGYAAREHEGYVAGRVQGLAASTARTWLRGLRSEGRYADQAREAELGLKIIRAQAAAQGEPAEATRLKEQEYLSTVHATAMNGMLVEGNIDEAVKYLDSNDDELSATSHLEIKSRMQPLLLESMAERDRAVDHHGRPAAGWHLPDDRRCVLGEGSRGDRGGLGEPHDRAGVWRRRRRRRIRTAPRPVPGSSSRAHGWRRSGSTRRRWRPASPRRKSWRCVPTRACRA